MLNQIEKAISKYKYKHTAQKFGILFKITAQAVEFDEQIDEQKFCDIFGSLSQELGEPDFCHSYFGYIWRTDGKTVAYNNIDNYGHGDYTAVFQFDKMPFGRKITYKRYAEIHAAVKEVLSGRGFECNDLIHYNPEGKMSYIACNDKCSYLIIISRREIRYYGSALTAAEQGIKVSPQRHGCVGYNGSSAALKSKLEQILVTVNT